MYITTHKIKNIDNIIKTTNSRQFVTNQNIFKLIPQPRNHMELLVGGAPIGPISDAHFT